MEHAGYLDRLSSLGRFGVKPGLANIRELCRRLGEPQLCAKAVHVAGTNGKGAVVAMVDACLRKAGAKVLRYTSPHLVSVNERFTSNGEPVSDALLEEALSETERAAEGLEITYFEALTAMAFIVARKSAVDWMVLETGLGGRLDATNVCAPEAAVITKIGLDHCDWLGNTVEEIALEKAGIVKRGVPIVLAKNCDAVRDVVARVAKSLDSPFVYAPDAAREDEIPQGFSLGGAFNRENAVTALALLKILGARGAKWDASGLAEVSWPGRFQRIGRFIVDGAHNPPAMTALEKSLPPGKCVLVAGFCADKAVNETLSIISPRVIAAFAVKTGNPRSLTADALAEKMAEAGIDAKPCADLNAALAAARDLAASKGEDVPVLVCGSLFLAGEALVALGAWSRTARFDAAETFQNASVVKSKEEIRSAMRRKRRLLPDDAKAAAAKSICEKLSAKLASRKDGIEGATVAVYLASKDEIDLSSFIAWLLEKGCRVVAPRWNGKTYTLARLEGLGDECLQAGPMGILEPRIDDAASPREVGVWIVPGLAFTAGGKRLGYGGGWYDRLLSEAADDALKLGVAHDFQVLEDLPTDMRDILLTGVVMP